MNRKTLQKSTKFHSVLLSNDLDDNLHLMEDCILDEYYKVNFYQIYLLYQEEYELVDKHGEAGFIFKSYNHSTLCK